MAQIETAPHGDGGARITIDLTQAEAENVEAAARSLGLTVPRWTLNQLSHGVNAAQAVAMRDDLDADEATKH